MQGLISSEQDIFGGSVKRFAEQEKTAMRYRSIPPWGKVRVWPMGEMLPSGAMKR